MEGVLPECRSFAHTRDLALSAVSLTHLGRALPLEESCVPMMCASPRPFPVSWRTPVTLTFSFAVPCDCAVDGGHLRPV